MKPLIDESTAFLSAFDIEGLLLLRRRAFAQNDYEKLMKDQNILKEDYEKACERILRENRHIND